MLPWQYLNFFPDPQGHLSFLPTFLSLFIFLSSVIFSFSFLETTIFKFKRNLIKSLLIFVNSPSNNKNASKIIDLVLKEKDILVFIDNIPFISGIKHNDKILNGALNGELLSTLS